MPITGEFFIGSARAAREATFRAVDPSTGEMLAPAFSEASEDDVAAACELAWAAFDAYRETGLEERAKFLELIAAEIEALGDELIERAALESGLPVARLQGERGRTCGQLRLFANVVGRGDWLGVRIDPALPDRKPLPRADLRQRKIALGPVAIFGASNFPLAFSVAGGDTASALAAGCPVVVKGHPSHPGTGELVASAIAAAVKKAGLPEGVFSLINGGREVGAALVAHPKIKAVGFTGSRQGGLALAAIAAARAEPIPVYAEMSSINPVLLFPHAVKARGAELGKAFVGSLSMGAGQFCTNPGLVLAFDGAELDVFTAAAVEALGEVAPAVMLSTDICSAYQHGVEALIANPRAKLLGRGVESDAPNRCRPALFEVAGADFIGDETLSKEIFGSSSVIIRCRNADEMKTVLEQLEGQLTATLHLDDADIDLAGRFLPVLERKAGRILANGWPTGVEVCHAMVHGGPFPSTSDSRTTSVGSLAIERFLRPVCYQNLPSALLPEALSNGNPLDLVRLIDGKWSH